MMTQVKMDSPWLSDNLTEAIKADSNFENKCFNIASDIQGQNMKLVTLVEKLGAILTDKDPVLRARGTLILAEVLHNLPADSLSEKELTYISAFFCDRLLDNHAVTPAVMKGILAIAQMTNPPQGLATQILTLMFRHVSCQTMIPKDRYCVFQILQIFIYNYTEELKKLGPDFVFGFMSAIDGERDACNLLLIFRMLPFFIRTFPLGHLVEEMFEIIACYFPVDYYPEDSEKTAVSRDNLAEALNQCLVATPAFAEFCYPFLLEKLGSKLKMAKLESFNVLAAGCKAFSIQSMQPFLLEIWENIQHEVLPGSDKEVRESGLAALKAIIHMVSVVAVDKQEAKLLSTLITYVLQAGLESLKEVELNLFFPAVRLFLTVCEASPAACQEVLKQVVPVLMTQFQKEAGIEQKVSVLGALTGFVAVTEHLHINVSGNADLAPFWANIPILYMDAAHNAHPAICREAFHGLAVSLTSLDVGCRQQLYPLLATHMKVASQELVRKEVLQCLKKLAAFHPQEVMTTIVQPWLEEQSKSAENNGKLQLFTVLRKCSKKLHQTNLRIDNVNGLDMSAADNRLEVFFYMDALCEIAHLKPFMNYIVPHTLTFVLQSVQLDKCLIGLRCLRKLVGTSGEEAATLQNYLYHQCEAVPQLVSWCTEGVQDGTISDVFSNSEIVLHTAKIIDGILKNQSRELQENTLSKFIPLFISKDNPLVTNDAFHPLEATSPWEQTQLVVLLEALLGSVQQDVVIPSFEKLVIDLGQLTIHTTHDVTHKSAGCLVANLVNKAGDNVTLTNVLTNILETVKAIIDTASSLLHCKVNSTRLHVWVTKALVIRGHKAVDIWVQKLLELLAHEIVGREAAEGFRLIMEDDEYLNMSNHCNIRILYRQRFFMVASKLMTDFHAAPQTVRVHYLVALAYLLQGVPKEVLLMDFKHIISLIVESLEQDEPDLLLTTLKTLISLLEVTGRPLESHLNTFIPRMLKLAQFPGFMHVRMAALQCLYTLSKYPLDKILPYKTMVVQQLAPCLDDTKRLVRKEAVKARSHWFIVDSPGSDKS